MKKLLCVILALLLAVSVLVAFSACGKKEDTDEKDKSKVEDTVKDNAKEDDKSKEDDKDAETPANKDTKASKEEEEAAMKAVADKFADALYMKADADAVYKLFSPMFIKALVKESGSDAEAKKTIDSLTESTRGMLDGIPEGASIVCNTKVTELVDKDSEEWGKLTDMLKDELGVDASSLEYAGSVDVTLVATKSTGESSEFSGGSLLLTKEDGTWYVFTISE